MSHWAEIDLNGKVLRVTVGNNNDPAGDEGYSWLVNNLGGTWIKTSYNTRGGIHYGADGQPDGQSQLNYNYAGVDMLWDEVGFYAPQPYPSWTLDKATYLWVAPTPMPTDGDRYAWNENTKSWDVTG